MKLRHLLAVFLLGVLPATAARAGVFISIAPPPLVTYEQPLCPTDGYLWTPGYWAYDYDAGSYYWVNGVWVPPPQVGYLWTPGYWGYSGGGYAFNEGYWGPTVGFYGGINYGYGYGGYGYYGGRWDGEVFRYNTAITRVDTRVVHNTFVDRNAIHNTTNSRASFNGRGGINARPDAAQLAAARGAHIPPTSAQTNILSQARTAHAGTPNQPAGRNRTANVARSGRTANPTRNNGASRSNPALANGRRSTSRSTTARRVNTGNPQFARTRGPQVSRGPQGGRGPQVVRQSRAPQPHGGQKQERGKKP